MKIKLLKEHLSNLEDKYFDLVWYARSGKNMHSSEVREKRLKVQSKYPIEITHLNNPKEGDWNHGFNSGMLAATRFLVDLIQFGEETANENFPFLDT
jgi:hypothetical protein